MKERFILAALLTILGTPALAAMQAATLAVKGMICAACPFTVKAALNKVEGVKDVDVSYKNGQAVVTFDDAKTSVKALTQATANAGYPSTVKNRKLSRSDHERSGQTVCAKIKSCISR